MIEQKMKNDLYWEHDQHFSYQEGCSTCWNENLRLEASKSWIGRLMTRLIWGDKIADSGWIDPTYR